jgi:hypothetical protein
VYNGAVISGEGSILAVDCWNVPVVPGNTAYRAGGKIGSYILAIEGAVKAVLVCFGYVVEPIVGINIFRDSAGGYVL